MTSNCIAWILDFRKSAWNGFRLSLAFSLYSSPWESVYKRVHLYIPDRLGLISLVDSLFAYQTWRRMTLQPLLCLTSEHCCCLCIPHYSKHSDTTPTTTWLEQCCLSESVVQLVSLWSHKLTKCIDAFPMQSFALEIKCWLCLCTPHCVCRLDVRQDLWWRRLAFGMSDISCQCVAVDNY